MEYYLDNYTRQPGFLLERLAANCKARRLERGYSRNTLSKRCGVPAPTLEKFERTGHISLEAFCRIAIELDYFEEMAAILSRSKYTTGEELETINKNRNRKKGR